MQTSLDLLCTVPADTLIWPGHEYAMDNLEFAASVDPHNAILLAKKQWVHRQRTHRLPTVGGG